MTAHTPTETVRPSALGPLRNPAFRAIWLGSAASNFGAMIQTVAAAWLMMSIAHSANMVALVQSAAAMPMMVFAPIAGALADNFDRRLIMLSAQLSMLAVATTAAVFAWLGWMTAPLLLAFTFLLAAGTAFNAPAWQASVGEMVPRRDLPSAVALNAVGYNVARSTGPAIGGALVALGGAATGFAVNAASYLGLIYVLVRWRPERPTRHLPRESLFSAIHAGVRYARMSSNVRNVLLRGATFGVASSGVNALMPLIARDLLGGSALTYGLLLGAFGLGAVGGALLSARLRALFSSESLLRVAAIIFALAALGAAFSRWLPLTMVALAFAGTAWLLAMSTFNVTLQILTPRWVVARALALYQMTVFGGIALGSSLWGAVAGWGGISIALVASAACMLLVVLLGFAFALEPVQDRDLSPLRAFSEPETAVAIEQRSGPVAITIEYRIAEQNRAEFVAAMRVWRRLRIRDGARNWALLRDLGDAEIWFERYESASWLEYLRHNQRFTQADAEVATKIRELHRGNAPPRLSRALRRG